jgi:hypothetical protein
MVAIGCKADVKFLTSVEPPALGFGIDRHPSQCDLRIDALPDDGILIVTR